MSFGTWHWLRKELPLFLGAHLIYRRRKRGREEPAEEARGSRSGWRDWGLCRAGNMTGAMALRTTQNSCAPVTHLLAEDWQICGKVCEKRDQLNGSKCTRRSWK